MPRASGKRRTSGRKLNLLPSKPQESRYVPQLFSRLLDVFIQCCLSVSILLANSRFHDGAPSPGPKTPTKRSPTHRSVAVTDSDRTHPESQAATQALQPYYGPDLDTPIKHLAEGGPLPLQRQYAKLFHIDEPEGMLPTFRLDSSLNSSTALSPSEMIVPQKTSEFKPINTNGKLSRTV